MTDILLPVALDIARVKFRVLDSVGVSRNPLNGAVRTAARGGDKLAATIEYAPTGGMSTSAKQRQRILRAHIAQLVRSNRVYLYDPGYVPQGSFPATELLTNNDFSNGTTGWSRTQAEIAVTDRVMRVTNTKSSPSYYELYQTANPLVVQYSPHVLRTFISSTTRTGMTGGVYFDGVSSYGLNPIGYIALANTCLGTTAAANPLVLDTSGNVSLAGDYADVQYTSLSRCILADNGPNALTYSDQIDNAAWSKAAVTVTGNYYTSPDGSVTADRIIEDTSSGEHYVASSASKPASAQDWCFCVALARGDVSSLRDRAQLRVVGPGGTDGGVAIFDLSAGSVVSTTTAGGGTNARSFIVSMGGGWFMCALVVTVPSSVTTIQGVVNLIENPSTTVYTGTSSRNIGMWRATLAQSSVPVRLTQTTTTATTGTSQSGSTIYVKGGPASASGSLLFGDWVEVHTSLGPQLTMVVSALDFDAAGLGVLRVSPPIRGTVADNAAIIVHQPMGRFLPAQGGEWQNDPGIFTTATAMDFEEAPA